MPQPHIVPHEHVIKCYILETAAGWKAADGLVDFWFDGQTGTEVLMVARPAVAGVRILTIFDPTYKPAI
jgi:hypothetical protein